MIFIFFIILLLLSNYDNNIWNETCDRGPIKDEWVKWCPPIKRDIDGSCWEKENEKPENYCNYWFHSHSCIFTFSSYVRQRHWKKSFEKVFNNSWKFSKITNIVLKQILLPKIILFLPISVFAERICIAKSCSPINMETCSCKNWIEKEKKILIHHLLSLFCIQRRIRSLRLYLILSILITQLISK